MVASIDIFGTRRTVSVTPANTSEATLYAVPAGMKSADVVALWIANLTASAANATVQWSDGTNDFSLIDTKSIAARDYHQPVEFFVPLPEAGSIKITSGTNSALTFTIVVVEFSGAVGGRQAA